MKTNDRLRFERVTDTTHRMYGRALQLYQISFPSHEQRESASQAKILRDNEYHFDLIYDGNVFIGLILYWAPKDFIYVEHFCVLPEMRNRKYGKRSLELLGQQGKIVILEIDPPIDEVSISRKSFYERSGFVENPYSHIHPPYHKKNSGHDLLIMSYPVKIAQAEYDRFHHYLERQVMANVFQEA